MTPSQPGIGLRSERGPVLGAVMMSIALVALDSTVLATVVPTIVEQLGGFVEFPWLFSIYLLTQAVTTPLYGRFADIFGRRPVLLAGIAVFVTGSVLCALAWTMPMLIVARAVQGIGAGAIQPVSLTIVGDLYTVAERSRVQGYIAAVWGASAVAGPAVGGVFADFLDWRWVFGVNVPIGVLAAVLLRRHLHEAPAARRHRIDYLGSLLLMVGCALLVLGLLEGGTAWPWRSATSAAVLGAGVLALAAFLTVQARTAEPVLPLWVLRRRLLVGGNLSQVGVGVLLMGLTSYVPTYVQGVLGTGAVLAGFAVAALSMGWPISAALAGRVYLRIGFRDTAALGAAVVLVGCLLCLWWGGRTPVLAVAAVCFLIGLGMGFTSAPMIVAVQAAVGHGERGVVTSAALFSRTVGSAVGVAVFGALANAAVPVTRADPGAAAGGIPPPEVLLPAVQRVFVGFGGVAAFLVVVLALTPRGTRPRPGH